MLWLLSLTPSLPKCQPLCVLFKLLHHNTRRHNTKQYYSIPFKMHPVNKRCWVNKYRLYQNVRVNPTTLVNSVHFEWNRVVHLSHPPVHRSVRFFPLPICARAPPSLSFHPGVHNQTWYQSTCKERINLLVKHAPLCAKGKLSP